MAEAAACAAGPPVKIRTVLTSASWVGMWRSPASSRAWSTPARRPLETKLSGKTRNERPWAAWGLPAIEAEGDEHPDEGEAVEDGQAERRQRLSAVDPPIRNPTAKAHHRHHEARPRPPAPCRRRPCPVTMDISRMGRLRRRSKRPPSRSSATPLAAPMPWNSTPVTTKPGTRKSTYVQVPGVGHRATEDVAEDQEEEHPLGGPGDDQRRRAHELLERAPRHLARGDEIRRAPVQRRAAPGRPGGGGSR